MPKKANKNTKSPKKKEKKVEVKFKKPNIKFKKPDWKEIKESKATKYSLIVLLVLLFFVVVDFGVQYLNNDYSAAVVNGERITEREYYYRLDQAYGNAIISQLIEETLIRQQAEKEGITVTEEEIQSDLDEIVEQVGGQEQLDASLEAYNLTIDDLKRQIELDIISTKLLEPTLEYTEDDVKAFFEQYSEAIFPEEAAQLEEGELLDYESFKDETEKVFLQQEVSTAKGSWLEKLKEESKIQDNISEDSSYRFLGATRNIIKNIFDELNSNEGNTETETTEVPQE
jgi:hypothetical protein